MSGSDRRILTKEDLDNLRIRAAKPFAGQGDGLDSSDCDLLFGYIDYLEENDLITPEEADRAYNEAEPIPMKPGEVERLVESVAGPLPEPWESAARDVAIRFKLSKQSVRFVVQPHIPQPSPSLTPGEVEAALAHVEGRLQYDASGKGDWACTECNEQEPRHKANCEVATLRAALSRERIDRLEEELRKTRMRLGDKIIECDELRQKVRQLKKEIKELS